MTTRTETEILQDIADNMLATWGNNPLADPVANRSNLLVMLAKIASSGQAELEKRFERYRYQSRFDYLSGEELDFQASKKCIIRKTCAKSKALIVVTGTDCSILQKDETLTDKRSREWNVVDDIVLSANGSACAYGVGIVEAEECGCWKLGEKELTLDATNLTGIYSATNSVMLEIGGEEESDEALRNRIFNTGVLSNVVGTKDALISSIYDIEGVNFARSIKGEVCGENGFMLIVHGGEDGEICTTIRNNGVACNLLGNVSCDDKCFDDIKFQRPCPVKLELKVTLNCDCPSITQAQAVDMIMSQAIRVANQIKIPSSQFVKLHVDIENVSIRVKQIPLTTCADSGEILIDPLDGSEITFGSNNPNGICAGVVPCDDSEYFNTVRIHPYQYPLLASDAITFTACDELEQQCNAC